MDLKSLSEMYFGIIEDPRCECNVEHKLIDILILVMCGILCGMDELSKIIEYGESKKDFLKENFGVDKIPSKSTLSRILAIVDSDKLSLSIVGIMNSLVENKGKQIAIDGKTIRSTEKMSSFEKSLHIITAYATETYISIGQMTVDGKTNEIPCAVDLIQKLDVKGKVLSLDALHCQKNTVATIVNNGANYIIGLKENQKRLYNDVKEMYIDLIESKFKKDKKKYETYSVSEKNRDRFEKRTGYLLNDISWLDNKENWKGLKNILCIKRETERKEEKSDELSFYLTSLETNSKELMNYVRNHWGIESMHHILDVSYDEDVCGIISEQSQKSLNIFRKLGLAIHKNYLEGKKNKTLRSNMFKCLLNDNVLLDVILSSRNISSL